MAVEHPLKHLHLQFIHSSANFFFLQHLDSTSFKLKLYYSLVFIQT